MANKPADRLLKELQEYSVNVSDAPGLDRLTDADVDELLKIWKDELKDGESFIRQYPDLAAAQIGYLISLW